MTSVRLVPEHEVRSRHSAGLFGRPVRRSVLLGLALALVAVTLAVYYPVNRLPFISINDGEYVTRNIHINPPLNWEMFRWSFTTFYAANWHPLTWLSHALDCQLFSLNSGRHHDSNLLLHVLNAVLLFWILWRATASVGRSFMVAALFALHPINVESVAWVAERKNLLSMLFLLLALGAYRWYARKPRIGRYVVVAILFALGLMSKPQVITLPFIFLLWDYWPLGRMFAIGDQSSLQTTQEATIPARSFSWLVLEKLPLLALSAASAFLTVKAQQAGGAMGGVMRSYSLAVRVENAIVSYMRYLSNAIWPAHLAFFYPHPSRLPAGVAGISSLAGDHWISRRQPKSPLSRRGMALVPGHVGSDDWAAPGWRPGHGRSLCVSSVCRIVHRCLLGCGGLGRAMARS